MKPLNEFLNESLSDSEYNKIKKHLSKKDEYDLMNMCNDFYVEDEEFQDIKHDLDYEELLDWTLTFCKDNDIDLKTIKSDFE